MFCVLRRNSRWPPKSGEKVIVCKMSPVHSADTLQVQNFVEITLSRTVSEINALYTEIQDGCQKWRESDFYEKLPVQIPCGYKILSKSLYLTSFPRLMRFCILCRNSRWPPKVAGKRFLLQVASRLFIYPAGQKCTFHAEIQDGLQKWQESDFCEKSPVDSGHPGGQKFRQNPCISQD